MNGNIQKILWACAVIGAAVFIYYHTDSVALFIGYAALLGLAVFGPLFAMNKLSEWLTKRDE